MSKNESNNLSRRKMLKLLGLGGVAALSPIDIFFENLANGILARAYADGTHDAVFTNKYIFLQEPGAPPRWAYDLFLQPYGGQVFPNGSVKTEYSRGQVYDQAIYKTYNVKGIQAPVIWTQDVARVESGNRAFSDLMDHMIVLQGIDALNPGHGPARTLMNRPLTEFSLDGLLADESLLPFSGFDFGVFNIDFKSQKGYSKKFYTGKMDDVENSISKAFEVDASRIDKKYHNEINRAIATINDESTHRKMGGLTLNLNVEKAQSLMGSEIERIKKTVPLLEAKYQSVIDRTLSSSKNLPGINDRAIGVAPDSRDFTYNFNGGKRVNNVDLRTLLSGAHIDGIAKRFALLEYVITQNLTANAGLATYLPNFNFNGKSVTLRADQHNVGVMVSVLCNTIHYRCQGALILTLIDALKATPFKGSTMFDHSVIRHGGEFSRLPRTNGSGSDHAPESSNDTIYSGMIDGPKVLGQIRATRKDGSYGRAGQLKNGVTATTVHVISSLAKMLGIKSPSPNTPSLLIKKNGKIEANTAYIDKTKVVNDVV